MASNGIKKARRQKIRRPRPRRKMTVKYTLLLPRPLPYTYNGAWGPSHRGSAVAHPGTATASIILRVRLVAD